MEAGVRQEVHLHLYHRCNVLSAPLAELGINMTLWKWRGCRLRPHQRAHFRRSTSGIEQIPLMLPIRPGYNPHPPPPGNTTATGVGLIDVLDNICAAPESASSSAFGLFHTILLSTNLRKESCRNSGRLFLPLRSLWEISSSAHRNDLVSLRLVFCISKRKQWFSKCIQLSLRLSCFLHLR